MALLHSPRIVTDGLILCLDTANTKSYPGSGTTWTDISASALAGTTSGVSYNSSNLGSLVYTASAITTVAMSTLRPTAAITQEAWFYPTSNVSQVFIGAQYGTTSNNSYAIWLNAASTWAAGVNIGGTLNSQTVSYTTNVNTWYHFIHTYDGTNQRIYANGSQIHSWGTTGSIAYDTNNTLLAVGNDYNGTGYNVGASSGIVGRLAVVRIYNKALTATEVANNFNALRGRYGV